jgi:glycosyltransferase involved in cell wall biosynthesis
MTRRSAIVLVGQTPPPFHGQALAIERLVKAPFSRIVIHHVPMDFSASMAEIGRVRPGKVGRLVRLIWRTLRTRTTTDARTLYYPPAGSRLVPVLRDVLFLCMIRPFFPVLVLDLHAGGLADMEERVPFFLRWLFRRAYHGATLCIERYPSTTSKRLPALRHAVVPYGVEDEYPRFAHVDQDPAGFTVLYVGVVTATKGVWTLLEAVAVLNQRGVDVRTVVVGEFGSEEDAAEWTTLLDRYGLQHRVTHTGRLIGDAKWREFGRAHAFCFPSYYENEALPIAIIEAMQFRLPVVATNWRGIPYLIRDTETGFLVPPRDSAALADRLEVLALNADTRNAMGAKAREIFLERYTVKSYLTAMERALASAAALGEVPSGG